MTVNVHVRDVPDEVHAVLVTRAEQAGTSLRQYVIQVLREHTSRPTMDEWLDEVGRDEPVDIGMSGGEAVRLAREEDDAELERLLLGRTAAGGPAGDAA